MFRSTKLIFTGFVICIMTALTGCSLGQAAEPTITPVDIHALETGVVATVQAQQTANAPTITPTFTITFQPTDTLAAGFTDTPGIPVEGTPSAEVTPAETSLFGTAIPSLTPFLAPTNTNAGPYCLDSAFAGDVTIPDGTIMEPWEKFDKVWAIQNTGTCTWDEGFYFAAISGPPSMGANVGKHGFKTPERFVDAGEIAYISIHMYAPGDPGEYVAHWHMFDDQKRPFGGDFTVVIRVEN